MLYLLGFIILAYILLCGLMFIKQEKLIFPGTQLPSGFLFHFDQKFEEIYIKAKDGIKLHGILFQTNRPPKGLVFYLHGNGGCVDSWGGVASTYTQLGYDLFILDYRGYGKSEGNISSETQLHNDVQAAYNHLRTLYTEDKIVVLGYSIGSGLAVKLAGNNQPQQLILLAPYHSLKALVKEKVSFVPSFILKYPLESYKNIRSVKAPIHIFHGDHDEVIPYSCSLALQKEFNAKDQLITLRGQSHNGIDMNLDYIINLQDLLMYK